MTNLGLASQLWVKYSFIHIPSVTFDSGETKSKFCMLIQDANEIWRDGEIAGCLTTSQHLNELHPWQMIIDEDYKVLGENQKGNTKVDFANRIFLDLSQLKKCRYTGKLPPELEEVADICLKMGDFYLDTFSSNPQDAF